MSTASPYSSTPKQWIWTQCFDLGSPLCHYCTIWSLTLDTLNLSYLLPCLVSCASLVSWYFLIFYLFYMTSHGVCVLLHTPQTPNFSLYSSLGRVCAQVMMTDGTRTSQLFVITLQPSLPLTEFGFTITYLRRASRLLCSISSYYLYLTV